MSASQIAGPFSHVTPAYLALALRRQRESADRCAWCDRHHERDGLICDGCVREYRREQYDALAG